MDERTTFTSVTPAVTDKWASFTNTTPAVTDKSVAFTYVTPDLVRQARPALPVQTYPALVLKHKRCLNAFRSSNTGTRLPYLREHLVLLARARARVHIHAAVLRLTRTTRYIQFHTHTHTLTSTNIAQLTLCSNKPYLR